MSKITSPPIFTLFPAPQSALEPARRLIILVPGLEADLTEVTRRVWELADATGAHIKFLGLCNDVMQEPSLRRTLVTMSAMVNYDNVSAETEVIVGRDWLGAVKSRCHPGNMLVCMEEQRTGLLRGPLSRILQSDLDVPLYILSGLYPQKDAHPNWPTRAAAWIGFLAILIGFFILQASITRLAEDWNIVLLLLTIPVEYWMILAWNNLFGQHTGK